MARDAAVIQVTGQDEAKRDQFVRVLSKTLRDQGYELIELSIQSVAAALASSDKEILGRAIAWASQLLSQHGILALVSVDEPMSKVLINVSNYVPLVGLRIDGLVNISASHQLSITTEATTWPQAIAQVVLILKKTAVDQELIPDGLQVDEKVYSAEEEARLAEHLKALGYL